VTEGDQDVLDRLTRMAIELGATRVATEAKALAERVAEGRYYVVCVGQFKRGKSTLLNALVGIALLPTGVVPVTTTVTVLRYGERLAARVRLHDGDWQPCDPHALADYVSEEKNPGNRRGASVVEVFVPSALLRGGMCLVDTPGLGSVTEANTLTTEAFVPHVDAALVVLGADPPISGDELGLAERVAGVTSQMVFVLNKADRVSDDDRRQALAFADRVLAERLGPHARRILTVSATEALAGSPRRWEWKQLVAALESLARTSGAELVRAAQQRGIVALATELLAEVEEQRAALVRPLAESEARVEALRAAQDGAQQSLEELGHRLTAVQERLSQAFNEARDAFLGRALPEARREIEAAIAAAPETGDRLRRRAADLAMEVAERWIERWRREEEPRAEALYREATTRFIELVNTTEEAVAALPGLECLPRLSPEAGFRVRSGFYYSRMVHVALASPGSAVADLLRTAAVQRRAVTRDANAYLARLLDVNTARIKNDFIDRVVESRRRLEADVRARLAAVSASAERALSHARETHAAGAEAVKERLAWLDGQRAEIEELVSAARSGLRARAPS
jgi:GTP-binding protein EngB required for normal cell division